MQKLSCMGMVLVIIASVAILFAGCSKGSAGPTGPQGATGPAGPTGPQGPQGNANVMVDTFTIVNAQWVWNDDYILFTGGGSFQEWFTRYYKRSFSKVTAGVIDSGMVLVYMTPDLSNSSQWSPLPYTFDTGNGYSYDYVYVTTPGNVELEFYMPTTESSASAPSASTFNIPTFSFKLVAVTGSMATSLKNSQIDKTNYGQVAKFLGL
jgi:hypothetical protein